MAPIGSKRPPWRCLYRRDHLTHHIPPPRPVARRAPRTSTWILESARWDPCNASFELERSPRRGIVCHWRRCGIAVGLWFMTLGHGALGLLLHNKIEEVPDLLVGLPFAWCFHLRELVQKYRGSCDVFARPRGNVALRRCHKPSNDSPLSP